MNNNLKNSERVKQVLIEMAIDGALPSDMNELDSNLFSFCDSGVERMTIEELKKAVAQKEFALNNLRQAQ